MLDTIKLIHPNIQYADDIMKFREEMIATGEDMGGCGNLRKCLTADEWLQDIKNRENKETCPKGKVTSDTYIAVRKSDNRIVGVIDLRHTIDHPILSEWGGHIGYCVRPDERRKGYATEMLRIDLEFAKQLGLKKVMITCSESNIASEKTIRNNGGIYEKTVFVDNEGTKRFWIEL